MVTIKDVAKEAGVAVETVSRVMNNRGYISVKTRKKVYDAMERLNYTPNALAQALSKKTLDIITVVVPHIIHPYFAKVLSKLEKECTKNNYKLFVYNSGGDEEKEEHVLRICQNNFVAGVVLFSADISEEILEQFHIPIVLVERDAIGKAYSIQCDNIAGGEAAAEHLISHGCKDMVVIGTMNTTQMPGDTREDGFLRVAVRNHCACAVYRSSPDEYNNMEYYPLIEQVLDEHPDCDGIFCTSDMIAAEVLQVCNRRGISVPDQIKVVGFDDVDLTKRTSPTITTIRQPMDEIVHRAVSIITDVNEGKKVPTNTILPVTLVERESTAVH